MKDIICEVYGIIGSDNIAMLSEIQIYDYNSNLIPYIVTSTDEYESTRGYADSSQFCYWNREIWDKTRLSDGNFADTLQNSTCGFCYNTTNLKTEWARFRIHIDSDQEIKKITTYVGGKSRPQATPVSISYYISYNYNKERDLSNRDNIELSLLGTLNFSSILSTTKAFDIILKFNNYLIKQNDQYYSIKPEFYQDRQFTPLTLSGGEQPNEDDYNNYGFDDIGDLCKTYDTEIHEADGESLGDGKMFTFDIPNDIKNINNIEY